MYVRRITRRRKDGSQVGYLQLAHKVRDQETGKPKDIVLHHFGREENFDASQIKRLIKSVSRFLPAADQVAMELSVGAQQDIEVEEVREFGGTFVLNALWKRLELDKTLGGIAAFREFRVEVERLVFAMVANRALAPSSKLGVERWLERVAIEGLEGVAVQQLYRAMDFLVENGEAIQKTVFFSTATLLNLEVDLLFFDTTSTYFEIEEEDESGPRRFGHSKDHRPDRPQVVIGLAVTRGGLPVRCWVLPGNSNDAKLVSKVQEDLAGWKLSRVVWVMDRGMTGADQKVALQRGGGHYIMGEKLRGGAAKNLAALQRAGRYKQVRDNLEVKEVIIEKGSERQRYVMVRNPAQAMRDKELREQLLQRLESEIAALNTRSKKGDERHSKGVCALKAHRTLGRYVRELKSGELRVNRAKIREEEKLDGKYLLSTSDPSLSVEDVALGYKQLLEVEAAFRTLKSTLDLRPVYHRLSERIEAHVLLCWLALLLVRIVERETGASWPRVRESMSAMALVKVRTKDGNCSVVSNPSKSQRNILKSLNLSPPRRLQSVDINR